MAKRPVRLRFLNMGFQFDGRSRLEAGVDASLKETKVVGPLPGDLHDTNSHTAAMHDGSAGAEAARALLRKLADPASRARWTAAWLEPAFPGA